MGIVIGVIVVIIVVTIIVFLKKGKSEQSTAEQIDSGSEPKIEVAEPSGEPSEETAADADVTPGQPTEQSEEPEPEAAEGVRLDESAEQEAAKDLEDARKERKLQKLRQGLSQTRGGLVGKISALFKEKKEIDKELLEQLEETLISSDVGSSTTEWLLTMIKEALDKEELKDPDAVWDLLKNEIKNALSIESKTWDLSKDKPFTIMVVGVNGAGKTTTIGKLASQLTNDGHKIVLAAADTFRAAAVNQLEIWARRTKSEIVKPTKEGADPSSVVFDAIKKAQETEADIVIADTAGRLHTQAPLMEELKKISRVMTKAHPDAPHEILIVLDASTGQNAIQQVKEFGEALKLTGIALTKLDGTAKGGVIVGICHEHNIPIKFIGIGETKDSLRKFEVEDFVQALFLADKPEDD